MRSPKYLYPLPAAQERVDLRASFARLDPRKRGEVESNQAVTLTPIGHDTPVPPNPQ